MQMIGGSVKMQVSDRGVQSCGQQRAQAGTVRVKLCRSSQINAPCLIGAFNVDLTASPRKHGKSDPRDPVYVSSYEST